MSVSHVGGVRSAGVGVLALPELPVGVPAVRELVLRLGMVPDPRDPRGVRHRLATILSVAVFAVLAGARTYREIGDRVADLPQGLLAVAGARPCPALGVWQAPSGSTVRRVLTVVDADAADRVVGAWLGSLAVSDGVGLLGLALDGKTVCRSGGPDGDVADVRLFSAMLHREAVVVAQVGVPACTTEVTQVRALLGGLDLKGFAVTGDAAHTQRDTASYLVDEREADYVLQVKANQPTLLRQIVAVMPAMLIDGADHSTVQVRDGDTVRRSIWIVDAVGVDFPGAVRVFRILRERFDPFGQRVSKEVVHGVTSLDADRATPEQVAGLVRSHWGIDSSSSDCTYV